MSPTASGLVTRPSPDVSPLTVDRRNAGPGSGAGPRILLLHGLANSGAVWDGFVDRWRARAEVWTAELPWRNDGDPVWGHEGEPSRWIESALTRVPGGVDLVVAHSMSANLLVELLNRRAADIRHRYGLAGAVLVSPFYRREVEDFRWSALGDLIARFEHTMREGIRMHATRSIDPELLDDLALRVCERVGPHGWVRFLDTYLRTPLLRTELITLPCKVIVGADDTTVPPEEGVALAEDLPAGTAELLDGCGHFPMLREPDRFAAIVHHFLDTLGHRPSLSGKVTEPSAGGNS
ncbi:alpha/beta fold hydrolase [Amycolatopsis cihanbeyliensis]|uniref:Pimeloyl-ACP methyl ester carboxylesterase n=1 Tax=Amycolatopsis cihanbeyliensis TaxID=1128664 RepID=A0A542DE75_AMYCI|nr:alpha/beta hydrolase [Amycolatopsis cihanbeyliensis]TQJ01374.1 pimeloyl-ACP methyl ester carboxylesterase [Amycolatopsis cihanbeyliensis]